VKIDVPLSIPEGVSFPEYGREDQLRRWIWRQIQIPQPMYLISTLKPGGVPNCEANSWGLPFGFAPNQMFAFVCGRAHHTAQNVLREGEFVANLPGAAIGATAVRAARSYAENEDEIAKSGLTAIPSRVVKPPRIRECFAHLECTLEWFKKTDSEGGLLLCGRIVAASGDHDAVTGDIQSKIRRTRPILVMPWNIDTERMQLTGGPGQTTAFADVGEVRHIQEG